MSTSKELNIYCRSTSLNCLHFSHSLQTSMAERQNFTVHLGSYPLIRRVKNATSFITQSTLRRPLVLPLCVDVRLALVCRRGGDKAALHPVLPGQPIRTDHPTGHHRKPESHLLSASLQGRTGHQLPRESGQEHQGAHALKPQVLQGHIAESKSA